jgi:hypothetical protein
MRSGRNTGIAVTLYSLPQYSRTPHGIRIASLGRIVAAGFPRRAPSGNRRQTIVFEFHVKGWTCGSSHPKSERLTKAHKSVHSGN